MIKAIIFDCFGVLVGRGFEETYRIAGGIPEDDRQFIDDTLGQANLGMISEDTFHSSMASKLGISQGQWLQAITKAEQPNSELLEYIKSLHGPYKTAILSNANRGVVESRVGDEWIKQCFDTIVVSADVGMIKPDPEIYKYTAEKLGVKLSECVFADDKQVFLEPAASLGMGVLRYQDFAKFKIELEALLANTEN